MHTHMYISINPCMHSSFHPSDDDYAGCSDGKVFQDGDAIGCFIELTESHGEISYSKNGCHLGRYCGDDG